MNGIRLGFRVGFRYSQRIHSAPSNMLSAREHPEVIRDYLAKECNEGRVLGPLSPALPLFIHTSHFGVIPEGSSGKWRLIVDMSAPEGASVNDGIDESLYTLSYVSIADAISAISLYSTGALLAKTDVKEASLPFGLRSAPKIFRALADTVKGIARREGIKFVIHYLDDFLIVGPPASTDCSTARSKLLAIFNCLGLPVAKEKLEGHTTVLDFLGFTLDTASMEVRLPTAKLRELRDLLHQWPGRKACTCRELGVNHRKTGPCSQGSPIREDIHGTHV